MMTLKSLEEKNGKNKMPPADRILLHHHHVKFLRRELKKKLQPNWQSLNQSPKI